MVRTSGFSQKVVNSGTLEAYLLEVYVPPEVSKCPTRLIEKGTGPWVFDLRTRVQGGSSKGPSRLKSGSRRPKSGSRRGDLGSQTPDLARGGPAEASSGGWSGPQGLQGPGVGPDARSEGGARGIPPAYRRCFTRSWTRIAPLGTPAAGCHAGDHCTQRAWSPLLNAYPILQK